MKVSITTQKFVQKKQGRIFFQKNSFYLRMVFVRERERERERLAPPILPMLPSLPDLPPPQLSLTMDWWLTELKVYLQNRTFQYFHFPYRQKRKRGENKLLFQKKEEKKEKKHWSAMSEWLSSLTWILNIDESGTIHLRDSLSDELVLLLQWHQLKLDLHFQRFVLVSKEVLIFEEKLAGSTKVHFLAWSFKSKIMIQLVRFIDE